MENIFRSILDEQLSSVEFVQDYLQLHFDGNILTFYSWPDVRIGFINYNIKSPGYRDALCGIITHTVDRVLLDEKNQLDIFFDNDSQVSLCLIRNKSNVDLAEFIYFMNTEKEWFILD